MNEAKSILITLYQEYHLNDEAGRTKKFQESQLLKQGREYLCSQSVNPTERFLILQIDFYKSILQKIARCKNFEEQEGSTAFSSLMAGFHSLEKYAINLWKFPWRREYHSIKLYTAFFKKNVLEKLQDMDAILSILKSLGYEKTLDEDQVQVKESVDAVRALWVSLDLFLVQLDLQIIKEIMDNFTDSKLSLKHFIKARARTCNVKDACQVLSAAAAKRAKTEKVQDSETSSQRQLTPTKIGDMTTTEDVIQVPAYAVSSADSESKNSDMSAATETTAMDTDETTEGMTSVSSSDAYTRSRVDPLHGYVPSSKHPAPFMGVNINDRDLYGAHAEENQLERKQERFVTPHGTSVRTRHLSKIDTKRMVDTSELTSQSLPYLGTTTSPLLSTRISTDTHIAYTDTSTRTGRQVQGSKYVGLPDIRGSASHQVASNASFQSYRPKENASQHKNSTAVEDRRQLSATEPMEVETQEARANRVENFGSYSSKMAEGGYARPEAQPGVSEYSHRSSRLNEFTGGAYALSKAHPGFSDLDRNRLHHLTLENGTSKRVAVQSSSAKEATSHGTGTTRVEYVPDDVVVSQSNCSPLPNVGTGYGHSLYKKEGNGVSDDVRHNTRSAARFLQDRGKSDEKFQESRLKRDYYSERSGKDPVPGAEATSLRKDEELKGATSKLDPKHAASVCGHCLQQGELMCRNCLLIACKECDRKIYFTELCGPTKDRHVFSELKSANSLDTSCSSPVYEGKEWSCSRCTFLNQLEHKICVMCAATRGVGDVEQSKPGSIVCRFCTFHNEQDANVCKACGKTLDKSESFV